MKRTTKAKVTAIGSSAVTVQLENRLTLFAQIGELPLEVGDEVNVDVTQDNYWWNDIDPNTAPPTFVAEILSVC